MLQEVVERAVEQERLVRLKARHEPSVRRLDEQIAVLLRELRLRIDPSPVSARRVPHTDLQTVLLHLVKAVLESARESLRVSLKAAYLRRMHDREHTGLACEVVRNIAELVALSPHIVDDRPSERNLLRLYLLALLEQTLGADADLERVPRAPAEVFEYFRIAAFFSDRAAVVKQLHRELRAVVHQRVRLVALTVDRRERVAVG